MVWKIVSKKMLLETPYLTVKSENCRTENGKKVDWFTVELRPWVVVAAFTPQNELLMIRQYRQSVRKNLLELPAGVIERNEIPISAAKREFVEETGYKLKNPRKIASLFESPGKCHESVTVLIGTVGKKSGQKLDESETCEVHFIPAKKVLRMVRQNKIESAPMVAAILLAKEHEPKRFA